MRRSFPGGAGDVSVYASDDTNILIDINGYFAPPVPAASLALYTVTPCRVLDTRSTSGPFTGQVDVQVEPLTGGGPCNLPQFTTTSPFVEAYVLNTTALPANGAGLGYLSVWPTGLPQPLPPSLVALDGAITSNLTITFSDNGYVSAFASSPTNMLLDISGYFSSDTLVITTTTLPAGNQFTPYPAFNMTAQGGVPPYSWTGAGFPAGIAIASSGAISATCVDAAAGTTPAITVTDSVLTSVTEATIPLNVNPYVAMSFVTTSPLPNGNAGLPYAPVQIVVQNGVAPYSYSVIAGALPPGLVLSATGVISGTPLGTDAGLYAFTIQVVDNSCDNPAPGNTITGVFTITIV